MIPDSTNQGFIFIEWQPDWSKPVSTRIRHETGIVTSNNGVEQRARRREQARYSISFVRSALDVTEFSLTRSMARQQLSAPLVCPLWTDKATLAQMTTIDRAALTTPTTGLKFKPGHYAYLVQTGTTATFRKILAVGSAYLDLDPATDPENPFPTFTAGATIYPAIVGFRPDNSAGFTSLRVNRQDHIVSLEEL